MFTAMWEFQHNKMLKSAFFVYDKHKIFSPFFLSVARKLMLNVFNTGGEVDPQISQALGTFMSRCN